jgi:hypothetical protein
MFDDRSVADREHLKSVPVAMSDLGAQHGLHEYEITHMYEVERSLHCHGPVTLRLTKGRVRVDKLAITIKLGEIDGLKRHQVRPRHKPTRLERLLNDGRAGRDQPALVTDSR